MQEKLTLLILVAALLTGCSAGDSELISNSSADYILQFDEKSTVAEAYPDEIEDTLSDIGVMEYTISEDGNLGNSFSKSRMMDEAAVDHNTLQFFPKTNTISADDGTALLYESYYEVEFSAQDPKLDAWVDSELDEIEQSYHFESSDLLKKAQEHYNDSKETFYTYSNYLNMGVARHDDRIMSMLAVNSVYSGGAHPITLQTSYNLDLKSKKCLKLEDIIVESAVDEMYQLVLSGLKEDFLNLGGGVLYDDYMETIQKLMEYGNLTPYWYLNYHGLVIYFNQYEIAPYAAGIIKVVVPYEDLEGILKEEYFPEVCKKDCGDLVIRGELKDYQEIPVQVGEGSTLMIGVNGTVQQVQLSEITWLDGMPISKRMLLSVNEMNQEDVIEIVGDIQDDSRSLSVEFQNGVDESKIYFIHEGELSEIP